MCVAVGEIFRLPRVLTTDTTSDHPQRLTRYWQPRYWPVWLGLGWLRLVSLLPFRLRMAAGRSLGWLVRQSVPGRRRVAAVNIGLCFPELPARERDRLVREHFASLGMTLVEHGLAWWFSDDQVRQLVRLRGAEHLQEALATGRGVVLLAGHFGSLEFTGRVLRPIFPIIGGLYRPNRNPFVDEILRRVRGRSASLLIRKQNIRGMIRTLRQGLPVWYAGDQSQRRSFSALIPFFGEPAMTTTGLSEIVRLGNALVVPLLPRRLPRRLPDGTAYTLDILPALENFPGASPEADALRINGILEAHIREAPEQYYWIHRRFKGRPAPYPDPYRTDV